MQSHTVFPLVGFHQKLSHDHDLISQKIYVKCKKIIPVKIMKMAFFLVLNLNNKPTHKTIWYFGICMISLYISQNKTKCSSFLVPTDACTDLTDDYCMNEGRCLEDDTGNATCECVPGITGPRCENCEFLFISLAFHFLFIPISVTWLPLS